MDADSKPVRLDLVACEVCLKQVPRSEAAVPEAVEYVMYFCGLECFKKWQATVGERKDGGQSPSA